MRPFPAAGKGTLFLVVMQFTSTQLQQLTTARGGEFAVSSVDAAFAFCRQLARSHYENFPVGSLLIPRSLQPHFFSVYAFSRIADDIADELSNTAEQLAMLDACEHLLISPPSTLKGNPVFTALHDTMQQFCIPPAPFLKLLSAFRSDIYFEQPRNWNEVLYYCSRSANPVGELVLRIFGMYTPVTAPLSDAICTGLQLANFWQDISVDRRRGRIYIPQLVLDTYGLTPENLLHDNFSGILPERFSNCLAELIRYTTVLFDRGEELPDHLQSGRLRLEIAVTIEGGRRILRATERMGGNIVNVRPTIRKGEYAAILLRAFRRIL